MISVLTIDPPAWDRSEIMRYARMRGDDGSLAALLDECIAEAEPALSYKVCYSVADIVREGDVISFGGLSTSSDTVRRALNGCARALIFAATVGAPFDRLIAKYSKLSPSKALLLQAIGAERAEALCDGFVSRFESDNGLSLRPRISPGYGDFPLEYQRGIFALLDCPRKIGLTLNVSLLMSPSKSVTAVAGIGDKAPGKCADKCSCCDNSGCIYRI